MHSQQSTSGMYCGAALFTCLCFGPLSSALSVVFLALLSLLRVTMMRRSLSEEASAPKVNH